MSPSTKKISLHKLAGLLISGLIFLQIGSGCNTRIEGCLDIQAENFDLNAEKKCSGCCMYPSMGLSLSQKWEARNFSNEDTLFDIHQQPYKILDLKYFLSSWYWQDDDHFRYTVDSVEAGCNNIPLRFTPDILTIDSRQFVYSLGTIRVSPLIDSLYFTLGLVEDFSCLDPEDTNTPFNLTTLSPLWNDQTSSIETIRLIIQRNLETEIFDTLFIQTKMSFPLDYDEPLSKGSDAQLMLSVNYAQWFRDVDILEISSIQQSILSNLQGSISRTQ